MEFTFKTEYTQKAITAMVKGLRKTLRRKKSLRSRVFGWLLLILAVALTLPLGGGPLIVDTRAVLCWAIAFVDLVMLLFEDGINAFAARLRMKKANETHADTTFYGSHYTAVTEKGKNDFYYGNIRAIAESDEFFVLVYDMNYGQVYDKRTLSGGTAEEFRRFLKEKTGRETTHF